MVYVKDGKRITVDSGTKHNPAPSTLRGKRRHAKRIGQRRAEVEKLWQ